MERSNGRQAAPAEDPVGYLALRLAITRSINEEDGLKQQYQQQGIPFVVTELGGKSDSDFQEKVNRAVIGAGLSGGVVKKTSREIHALLHATEEAKHGILVNATSSTSIALKLAIVRQGEWIAVAMYGESSIHPLTHHERCGLGIMHI